MKKILLFAVAMVGLIVSAQDEMESKKMDSTMESSEDFKRWAIDLSGGVHKPTRPFTRGYVSTPDLWQANLGARYMFTRSFGLGLGVGYNSIQSADDITNEFESDYLRLSLEGFVNLGNFVNLDRSTQKFNIMGHGGIGVGFLTTDIQSETDHHLNFMVGITPQYRISDNLALFTDLTIIGTTRNHFGWDGATLREIESNPNGDITQESRGFEGMLINASVGITYYLGKGGEPAEFDVDPIDSKVAAIEDMVATMARENADDDQDGVPNYLDRDNTTESGVRVDSKGRAIDTNKNGIPDDMESTLDARYASKADLANVKQPLDGRNGVSEKGLIKKLINEGYVNVYFKFNSTKPTLYSMDAMNTLVTYMKNNPSATATLTGYADELGSPEYNKNLSERRAKMVHDVLIASGVAANRLSHNGDGEDASVDKNSEEARQLVRRVTFRVN